MTSTIRPTQPFRIVLVGCGAVTEQLHAPALQVLEQDGKLEVVALHDPVLDQRHTLNAIFPRARPLATFGEVSSVDADLALVASPPGFHAEQTVRCLEAGLSVLCEKPMAVSTAEARAMIAAANEYGKLLAVGHVRRFFATTQLIKRIIDERRFGPMRSFHVTEGGSFEWSAKSASFFDRAKGGGGVFIDNGIHVLDLLLWWFGQPQAYSYEDDAMGGVEANCRLEMDYGSFRGDVRLTRDYRIPNQFSLEFEKAYLRGLPYTSDEFEIGFASEDKVLRGTLFSSKGRNLSEFPTIHAVAPFDHMFLHQWRNVLAAQHGLEPLRSPGEEAIKSLAFVESCYSKRTLMESPWFTEHERIRARALTRTAGA